MASSYSTDLKLELMVTGENSGTWGDKTNTNLQLIQQAVAGYEAVALTDSGTVALAMTQEALSNARNMIIKFTGTLTGASTVTIPDGIEKFYIFDLSAVVGVTNLTIKTVSGTGFTAGEAKIVAAYSDGTNLNEIALNTLGGTIGSAQIDNNAITTALLNTAAVTTTRLNTNAVNTARLDTGAVTTSRVGASAITQAKLAADSVGPNQLISTGVTAAEYTSATITVDADGRITAASSGAAGGGAFVANLFSKGPSSGTYTANPSANLAGAYICGGGGGGAGGGANPTGNGGTGGDGGYGFFTASVTGGTGYSYTAGGGGAAGPGSAGNGIPGSAGSPSNVTNIGTANGGAGGNGGNPGNTGADGTAVGANGTFDPDHSFIAPGGTGGNGGSRTPTGGNPGNPGEPGFVAVMDNVGV